MPRAIRVYETGGPEKLVYEEFEAAPPAEGEIQIAQRAIGVNYLDVYFRSGLYPSQPGFIPGSEGAGDVVALGAGVKGFKIGDRVAWTAGLGGYAEICNVPAHRAVKLPKSTSYETGAALMLKGLTAQYLLRQSFRLKEGHVALVHAAAGGVGQILCQWGKALGATVIGTVSTPEKAKIAKKAGAKHVIDYSRENFVERVREITKGKLCDVVYDGVGKNTFPASLDCIRPLGSFISFGNASGPVDAFNLGLLAQKGSLFVQRPTLFTYASDPERLKKMTRELMKVVGEGTVKIRVTDRYPLAEARRLHEDLEARRTAGAVVLIP